MRTDEAIKRALNLVVRHGTRLLALLDTIDCQPNLFFFFFLEVEEGRGSMTDAYLVGRLSGHRRREEKEKEKNGRRTNVSTDFSRDAITTHEILDVGLVDALGIKVYLLEKVDPVLPGLQQLTRWWERTGIEICVCICRRVWTAAG